MVGGHIFKRIGCHHTYAFAVYLHIGNLVAAVGGDGEGRANILKSYIEPGGRAVFYSTHNTTDLDKSADMLIMINAGKILFEEEKDFLLDKFRVVKGDVKYLSPDIKSLMLHFEKSKYGFTGISDNASKIKSLYPDVLLERASIEDIMLAYVKEGE